MKRQLPAANAITEGVIWQQVLLFFFPILFGTFFQQLETALAGYPELKVAVVTSLSVLNGTSDGSGLTLDLLKQYADRVFVAVPDGQTLPTIEGLEIVPIVAQGTGEGSWAVLR